ncbi:tRNA dihydrouridine synthase [Thecaphora frezii]
MPEALAAAAAIAADVIPDLDSFPPTGTPLHPKLASWDFYRAIGSPHRVVAPMVDQSELAWRILSRRYGSDLVYTPMINAKLFVDAANADATPPAGKRPKKNKYQETNFNRQCNEEGAHAFDLPLLERHAKADAADAADAAIAADAAPSTSASETAAAADAPTTTTTTTDRPLLVQFCANDSQVLLKAAEVVQDRCDGVDLNLGCPQHIAKRGHYGSYLMEDWPLIFSLVNILHLHLKVPVTAKMRVYDSVEKTVAYARMLERAGAQILTVHGRTREMKGHKTGLADWQKIRAVKQAVKIPVLANGNVLYPQDWRDAMHVTGADGVMSAEGNLYNPAIFATPLPTEASRMFPMAPRLPFPSITAMADEYLDIVAALRTPTSGSAVKAHLFRLCRPALEVHRDLREMLGKARLDTAKEGEARVLDYRAFVKELERRLEADRQSGKYDQPLAVPLPGSVSFLAPRPTDQEASASEGKGEGEDGDVYRPSYIPHWLAQPYFRPPLPTAEEKQGEAGEEKKRARQERVAETKGITLLDDVQTKGEVKLHEAEVQAEAEDAQRNGVDASPPMKKSRVD